MLTIFPGVPVGNSWLNGSHRFYCVTASIENVKCQRRGLGKHQEQRIAPLIPAGECPSSDVLLASGTKCRGFLSFAVSSQIAMPKATALWS
jgi:hypothetical protein